MERIIKIYDTTLRDGEQAPGFSINMKDKLEVAKQLELLRVDAIEAGFSAVSEGDFLAVKNIAKMIKDCSVASLCRAIPADIDSAWSSLKKAQDPILHIFIATSDIHMEYKLKKTPEEVLYQAVEAVRYAKSLCPNVRFAAEDATRTRPEFLYQVIRAAISAGATTIDLPDTVGYLTTEETYRFFEEVMKKVPELHGVEISAHCHNDLGLGVANSLMAICAGVNQVDCTINGIGERAGNAALEEIVMGLKTRKDFYGANTRIDTTKIYRASKILTMVTGVSVQPNKAIVGANAFSHESGIHQHGVLANSETYEILKPESVGFVSSQLILGKHSGRHAFDDFIARMGYVLTNEDSNTLFDKFKQLSDRKNNMAERDIEALVFEYFSKREEVYVLDRFVITSGNTISATAVVRLKHANGEKIEEATIGDGPINAAYNAIDKIVGEKFTLAEYKLEAVTEGKDALGEVKVRIQKGSKLYSGRGLSTDIIEASVLAYLSAINNMLNSAAAIMEEAIFNK